jgi:hypothetical protein
LYKTIKNLICERGNSHQSMRGDSLPWSFPPVIFQSYIPFYYVIVHILKKNWMIQITTGQPPVKSRLKMIHSPKAPRYDKDIWLVDRWLRSGECISYVVLPSLSHRLTFSSLTNLPLHTNYWRDFTIYVFKYKKKIRFFFVVCIGINMFQIPINILSFVFSPLSLQNFQLTHLVFILKSTSM